MISTPEIELTRSQADALLSSRAAFANLELIEADLQGSATARAALHDVFTSLRERALAPWRTHHHLILRRVPAAADGATGLLVAGLLFRALRAYRGDRIVKSFRMTPWTTALSHTLAEGSFHTDLNTASRPPAATMIQCVHRDPDAPRYGQLRVAPFRALVEAVRIAGHAGALQLLTEEHVAMVNDTSPGHWSGKIFEDEIVRFHPETLRAAQRRLGTNPADLEDRLRVIHEVAISISTPIDLTPGDVLVVSNHRALHQRGACTVRFRTFPRDFESRSVAVMHAMDELQ